MIELKNISKTFITDKQEIRAVDNVSLNIGSGEIFGIIGFSGAGKSTLVRCINLLERPDSGTVSVGGRELTSLTPKQLRESRKSIGMIFQHFNLMRSRTVADNVAFALSGDGLKKREIFEKVRDLLELVGISDKANAYPSELSGGQKQRVAIARALAKQPQVLLCDEATSALDPKTTASILQLLKKLNLELGITVIIITHEMAVVKQICSRVAVMENGRVVEQGDVFSIFANPQQPITREFIATTSNLQKINELLESGSPITKTENGQLIIKLKYLAKSVSESLICSASRNYNVDFNIIFSDIEIIDDSPIGGIVAIVSGTHDNVTSALKYLSEKNVGVEVLKNAKFD